MQKFRRALKKCGFTLVELIVVIAILGVLAAILIPTFLGFTRQANTASANKTATELKKSISLFLTQADANAKNYMLLTDGAREVFTITITNGVWTVSAAQHPDAFSPDTVTWGHDATVDENTSEVGSAYGEELLGIYLRKSLSTLKNGTLQANCVQGVCLSVWYSADGTPGEIHDLPTFGATDAWVDDEGNPTDTHHWNGTAGVNSDGMTIGTAPALSIA